MSDVYSDDSEVELELEEEEPPSEWIDQEEFIENPTEDELAMGQLLGESIDVDNDEDNGADVVKAIDEMVQ